MDKSRKSNFIVWLPLLLASASAVGMLVGYRVKSENIQKEPLIEKSDLSDYSIKRVEEILRYIDAKYIDTVELNQLVDAATFAILDKLDPFSVYIPKSKMTKFTESMEGYYHGLGIETVLIEDTMTISYILPDSPAFESGLVYGDKIVTINDSTVIGGKEKIDLRKILKSRSKESLTLSIIRDSKKIDLELTSGKVKYPNVSFYQYEGISYVNILKFSDKTFEDFVNALEALQKNGEIEKLIIDLRDNPGGYLPEATKILNQLFEEDKRLLVYTKNDVDKKTEYKTTGRPFYRIKNISVIINKNSASASEIIAGVIQDCDKGTIVGDVSYGKGLVQEQYPLKDGGAIRLTTSTYHMTSGRNVQKSYPNKSSVDTSKYFSKRLNRLLVSNQGVVPDFQVIDSEHDQHIIDLVNAQRGKIAFRINQRNLGDVMTFDMINTYFDQKLMPSSDKTRDYIAFLIKKEILKQNKTENKVMEYIISEDPYIKEAIHSFQVSEVFE